MTIANGNPTFTESQITYNDSDSNITKITGSTSSSPIIVKGKSTLAVTFTAATGKKEASISKYELTLNGVTKTASTAGTVSFGVINANSNLTLTAKVTDSRGNSTTVTKTIVIEQYTKPTLSPYGSNKAIICGRSDSSGTIDRMGTSLKISVKGACFSLSNGKNTAELKLTLSGTTGTIPLDSTNYNKNVPDVTLNGTTVYTATIKCIDKFQEESAPVTFTIPSQYADFNLRDGGRGAAFGEMATESNVLSVAAEWLLKAKGGISLVGKKLTNVATPTDNTDGANKSYVDALISKIYPVGAIYMSVNSTSPSTLFGGTWVQIKDTFLLAAGTTYSAGATGGSATNTHHHYSSIGSDGKIVYFTQAGQNYISSRVVTAKGTHIDASANYSETKSMRENATYDESISIMPPYLAVYVWKRTA